MRLRISTVSDWGRGADDRWTDHRHDKADRALPYPFSSSIMLVILLPVIHLRRRAMQVTSKGQVTIPKPIREKLGIRPKTDVEFVEDGKRVYIRKSRKARPNRFEKLRGVATVRMTTDEILALTRGE